MHGQVVLASLLFCFISLPAQSLAPNRQITLYTFLLRTPVCLYHALSTPRHADTCLPHAYSTRYSIIMSVLLPHHDTSRTYSDGPLKSSSLLPFLLFNPPASFYIVSVVVRHSES